MDSRILADILAAYENKRQVNEQEENRRLAEIRECHPDLDALIRERHEFVLQSVRSAFSGATQQPEDAMADYNRRIAQGLKAHGYPADYLSPVCQCALCQDQGFVYENGLRKPCECLKRAYITALSQTGRSMQGAQTFSAFDESRFPEEALPGQEVTQREYMRLVRRKCQAYADGIPHGPIKTLLLHGGSGLGKTFLLNCVGNAAREKGIDALYVTAYELLMALKTAYFSRTGETAQEYFDAPLLLIDDLGMEPLMEGITVEQIYNLLNARLIRGLYTAVSTNLNRVELKKKYTERVSSRLLDTRTGMAIPFLGRDIRLLKNS
ncbi:MAG: ATP-binding protein [Clostridia bacterium]|nr:ATP-binding protein [Clostridia bacterium]